MSAQHTPGPWTAEIPPSSCLTTRQIVGPNREPVASIGLPGGYTCGVFEDVANARLIAAAPELLEALKKLREECQLARKYIVISDDNGFAAYNDTAKAIGIADAAIAKAEGRA